MHYRTGDPSRRGSAIILVLWCVLVLGVVVMGVMDLVEFSVESTTHDELALEARALALSGVALGLNPQLVTNDPLLSQKISPGHQFNVTVQSEGARLNLNYVLLSNHREILINLFSQWGLKNADADHVADCLYDWVTPGDLRSLNGAKADDYAQAGLPQRPSHQPFISFEEANEVMGMDLIQKVRPDWRDSFTLWSSGPLDVNEAPAELIAAVFGLDPARVALFTQERNGKDGIAGTPDDVKVSDTTTLQRKLGVDDLAMQHLGNQISFNDPARRVESVGEAEKARVALSVVTRLNTSPIQYLLWYEH